VIRWRAFLLSRCQLLQAMLKGRSGDHEAALSLSQAVVQRIDSLSQDNKHADDQLVRWQLGAALLASGDHFRALSRSEDARRAWERAVTVLAADQEREDALMQIVLAAALMRLDRRDDAAPIVARLQEIEYRHPDFAEIEAQVAREARDKRPAALADEPETIAAATTKHADGRRAAPVH